MAQHDYVIANGTGAAVRSDINNGLAAIVSNNSGASAPATTYAYMLWADTSTNLLKLRNGANSAWITVGDLTATNLGLAALASPTFTGTVTIPTATISTGVGIPLGSAASPTIYFTGDTNTGIYSPGADQFAITTGGSGRVFVDSSGRVGLGTSSPSDRLEVNGNGLFYGNTGSQNGIYVGSNSSYNWSIQRENVSTGRLDFSVTAGGSPSTKLTILPDGRVGIGTQTPGEALTVGSGNAQITSGQFAVGVLGTSGLQFINDGTFGTVNSIPLAFRTAATERARIDTSGRLLVGTSTALSTNTGALLQLNGTGGSEFIGSSANNNPAAGDPITMIRGLSQSGSSYGTCATIAIQSDATTSLNDYPGRIVFSTTADGASSPTEHMRIDNAGNLMVRTTTSGTTNTEGFNVTYAGGSTYSTWGHKNGTSAGQPWCVFSYNGGSIGSITQNGTTGASFNTTSDYRLKENIVPLTGAAARLSQIPVHRFNFIADPDRIVDGFIAHEAQAVVPECVTGEKDAVDADGNPVYQGIDQSKLVPLLTAALQEALAEIESLKARVTALEP